MKRLLCLPISIALIGAACTGSGDESGRSPIDTTVAEAAPVSDGTVTAMPDTADLGAGAAVVRVETTGTFVSPEFGELDSVAGSGSAFIIDQSGLAVTNNHVVAGAASVEVFFDGTDEPIAASVVASSECSDLAVIDLAGDGYTPLGWSSNATDVGLGIHAAGYPEGHPGLTLTRGIVARVDNDGATPWASIPTLLRHDAEIAPGSSGGPIIDEAGNVVGVNVAASDSGRYAIPSSVAEPIVATLRTGTDVDSIGINAIAVSDDVTNESGVWVVSVEAGSPAAAAGVQAGDVITRMKGIRVGQDATLADYCSVVRSAGSGELPVEITRDNGYFAGSVRGTTPLSQVLEATDDIVDTANTPPPTVSQPPPPGTPYEAFDTVTDDTGTISIDVPTAWADRTTERVSYGGGDWPQIAAAYDLDALFESTNTNSGGIFDEPGVEMTVYRADIDIDEAFNVLSETLGFKYSCTPLDQEPFNDAVFEGVSQGFMDCAGTSSAAFSIAIKRSGEPGWAMLNITAPTVADLEASVRIAGSITFDPINFDEAFGASEAEAEAEAETDGSPDAESDTTLDEAGEPEIDSDERPDVEDDTSTESASPPSDSADPELPGTMSTAADIVDSVGLPPMAGDPFTTEELGFELTAYPTAATESDLRAWMDERFVLLGCDDPVTTEVGVEGLEYSLSCVPDAGSLVFGLLMFVEDGQRRIVVSVFDFDAE